MNEDMETSSSVNKSKDPFIVEMSPLTNSGEVPSNALLQETFTVNGLLYYLILTPNEIILDPVERVKRGKIRKLSGIFRSNRRHSFSNLNTSPELLLDGNTKDIIYIRNIYATKVLFHKISASQEFGEGRHVGFVIFVVEQKINKWKQRAVSILSTNHEISQLWVNSIQKCISDEKGRVKKLKVVLQPHAGNKDAKFLYRSKLEVLFQMANVTYDLLEIQKKSDISLGLSAAELSDYDCILCVGGDGTVSEVVNILLSRAHQDLGLSLRNGLIPRVSIPIGIVPIGTTNLIAMSIFGTDDPMTGALHAILGHRMQVDICSVYHQDNLIRWCFTAQYGFGGNVMDLAERYKFLGQRKMEVAFVKALTKSKLRGYNCDIDYLPCSDKQSRPDDGNVCYTGCSHCCNYGPNDEVEEFNPLNVSNTSSTIADLSSRRKLESCKGDYYSVSVLCIPARCSFARQGLSKYTHLSDGCLDLVLVRSTDRKHFVRHLRRMATSKDQFDFPFVETRRVREARVRPRISSQIWTFQNWSYHESLSASSEPPAPLVQDFTDVLDFKDSDEDSEGESIPDTATPSPKSTAHLRQDSSNNSPMPSDAENKKLTAIDKKVLKKKTHKEKKEKSVWSLDGHVVNYQDLTFVAHKGLVTFLGMGVSPLTEAEEGSAKCLLF